MKNIVSIFLIYAVLFTFTACSSQKREDIPVSGGVALHCLDVYGGYFENTNNFGVVVKIVKQRFEGGEHTEALVDIGAEEKVNISTYVKPSAYFKLAAYVNKKEDNHEIGFLKLYCYKY